jgi:hypothetical protein
MAKGTKPVVRFVGIASFLLGIAMFIIPYIMDAANRMVRDPSWWETHKGVVDYFWHGSDMLWAYVTGMVIFGLVLVGASFALKD